MESMDTYYNVAKFAALVGILAQSIMLALQSSAWRRHKDGFFVLLCLSSICGLVCGLLTGLAYFLPFSSALLHVVELAIAAGILGAVLAILGTARLFASYRNLSETVAAASTGGT
jgi:hypothetical protein